MKATVSIACHEEIQEGVFAALDGIKGLKELVAHRHVTIKPNDTW